MRQKDLKATFFIPGWTAEQHQKSLVSVVEWGHEIGHHGWIHEWPTALTRDEEKEVLEQGLSALRKLTGKDPVGYRSPAWEFSDNTLALLSEYGFKYSTNLMSHFIPWQHAESGIIELPVSWLLDDAPYFLYGPGRNAKPIHSADDVMKIWVEEFQGIYKYGGLFNLTMHPQIIGRPGRVQMLERLIDYINSFPDVWWATGSEVADYWVEHGDASPISGASFDI